MEREKATIVLNEAPSHMRAWNAFRLAGGLVGVEMQVEVFLLNDGVFCAMRGQNPPDEIVGQQTGAKISELLSLGVRVRVCSQCAMTRGISEEGLVEGVEWSSMIDLAKSIKESQKVVSF